MKPINRLSLFLLIAILLLGLSGCSGIAAGSEGLVLGDAYRLESGQTLDHDLTVVGGNVTLEQNSTLKGNLAVIGGNVNADGTIMGDLSAIGGYVSLGDHAVVQGQLSSLGGDIHRSSKAVVEGKTLPNNPGVPGPITTLKTPAMQVNLDPITTPLMAIFQALALAALAIVANLFAARPMERTGRAALMAPAASGGVGCLTLLVLVIMAITIILLPISALGLLVVGVAGLFGWLSLGLLLGRQIAIWLKQEWTDPVNAGVGTLVLSLLASMVNLIPCIGWTAYALVGLIALGAAVLSRFGTQIYPAAYSASAYPSAPAPRAGPYAPPAAPRTPPAPQTPAAPQTPPANQPDARVYGPESDYPEGRPPEPPAPPAEQI